MFSRSGEYQAGILGNILGTSGDDQCKGEHHNSSRGHHEHIGRRSVHQGTRTQGDTMKTSERYHDSCGGIL